MIIHLNGWPGAGKKTIGQIVAKRLDARFIHNHLLHDVAIACAGLSGEDRWDLYETVRSVAYETLATRPSSEVFVMTNALCKNSPRELEAWKHVVDLAVVRQVPLVPIVLVVEIEENCRRIQSEERVGKKMTDAEELRGYFSVDSIQEPDVPELLILDVTMLTPEKAAERICAYIAEISSNLQTATERHLQMR
jgi:gluconate kinase